MFLLKGKVVCSSYTGNNTPGDNTMAVIQSACIYAPVGTSQFMEVGYLESNTFFSGIFPPRLLHVRDRLMSHLDILDGQHVPMSLHTMTHPVGS